jgi:hypothetical protein
MAILKGFQATHGTREALKQTSGRTSVAQKLNARDSLASTANSYAAKGEKA